MKLHEYQAKGLLARYGVSVPSGQPGTTPQEVRDLAHTLGGRVVVKAQVHSGGRGKAGGIVVADTPTEAENAAKRLLGSRLITVQSGPRGLPVNTVLVEQPVRPERELYLAMLIDPSRKRPVVIACAHGGMDVEEIAAGHPEQLASVYIDPVTGLVPYQARAIARTLNLAGSVAVRAAEVVRALYRLFVEKDCSLIELNPLVVTGSGEVVALDAKVSIDDNALFRQPEMATLQDETQIDALEREAAKAGVSYVKLDGSIGCLVNGAGLAMATMDLVTLLGGRPANFLDVGGAADKDRVCQAIDLLLDDADVKVAWINIFGGILRCDVVARALLRVLNERHPSTPFVVRMQGTNADEARDLLATGPMRLMLEPDLARAARLAVASTGAPSRKSGGQTI